MQLLIRDFTRWFHLYSNCTDKAKANYFQFHHQSEDHQTKTHKQLDQKGALLLVKLI
jgi:hypothetical protein